jgi:hypothetical protein
MDMKTLKKFDLKSQHDEISSNSDATNAGDRNTYSCAK